MADTEESQALRAKLAESLRRQRELEKQKVLWLGNVLLTTMWHSTKATLFQTKLAMPRHGTCMA